MKAAARKSSVQEAFREKRFGTKKSTHLTSKSVSAVPTHQPIIQRKPGCPCGGGCPRCQEETLIKPKSKIGAPNDKYEQEADRVAEQVMRLPEPAVQHQVEEEELLQAKSAPGHTPEATPTLANRISALRGGGQPLDPATRAFMEPRLGQDFGQVRVHTDARAAETAESVNARAFTLGQDVVFGAGQYSHKTREGQRLLAHELTHVVQQGQGAHMMQRKPVFPDDSCKGVEKRINRLTDTAVDLVSTAIKRLDKADEVRSQLLQHLKIDLSDSYQRALVVSVKSLLEALLRALNSNIDNYCESGFLGSCGFMARTGHGNVNRIGHPEDGITYCKAMLRFTIKPHVVDTIVHEFTHMTPEISAEDIANRGQRKKLRKLSWSEALRNAESIARFVRSVK